MHGRLETEYYLRERPASAAAVEHACALAVARPRDEVVAVAVAPANVARAANLLFGTGIGIVSSLDDDDPERMLAQARLSVATGATEVALPRATIDQLAVVRYLKSFLGSSTALTVDITTMTGAASLGVAEQAMLSGADFVAFSPTQHTMNAAAQAAGLVALAEQLGLGGIKLASGSCHHLVALRESEWARTAGKSRLCLPVDPPSG